MRFTWTPVDTGGSTAHLIRMLNDRMRALASLLTAFRTEEKVLLLDTHLRLRGYVDLKAVDDPGTPPGGHVRMFCRDNGAGKMQLVVRAPGGAETNLWTEP